MIGNMTDKAGAAFNAIDVSMTYGSQCDYDDYENARELYEDAVTTDAVLRDIRMILRTAKATLERIDHKNTETRNGVLEMTISGIYNILLTPEGKPK